MFRILKVEKSQKFAGSTHPKKYWNIKKSMCVNCKRAKIRTEATRRNSALKTIGLKLSSKNRNLKRRSV
jgi:hypothetical protein